jgi:hypothetical protein|tara:strand:+ start:186 stop:416 length:231 start_codon:yes stop_codon:yes gene_type:complete
MIIPPDTQNQPWRKDRIRNAANNRVTNGRLLFRDFNSLFGGLNSLFGSNYSLFRCVGKFVETQRSISWLSGELRLT